MAAARSVATRFTTVESALRAFAEQPTQQGRHQFWKDGSYARLLGDEHGGWANIRTIDELKSRVRPPFRSIEVGFPAWNMSSATVQALHEFLNDGSTSMGIVRTRSFSQSSEEAPQGQKHLAVHSAGLLVRDGPTLESRKVATLPYGAEVTVLGDASLRRLLIQMRDDGMQGWVTSRFVQGVPSELTMRTEYSAGAEGAYVRIGHAISTPHLRTLYAGEPFELVAERVQVSYTDPSSRQLCTGWATVKGAKDQYLQKKSGRRPPEPVRQDREVRHRANTFGEALAERADEIMKQIEQRTATTEYMHRPDADWRGDVEPKAIPSRRDGRHGGSVWGNPARAPRFFVDCAGFVRELISDVDKAQHGGEQPSKMQIQDLRIAGTRASGYSVWGDKPFLRAYDFAKYFNQENLPNAHQREQGKWGCVTNPKNLRPGDIVAYGATDTHTALHTGHVWLVTSKPDSAGNYNAIESVPGTGAGRLYNTTGGIIRSRHNIHDIGRGGAEKIWGMGRMC
jgi:hypothetical protein